MFVDFKNVDDANLALATIHGHPFDAKHTFKVNRFSDIEKYAELDETYVEPELEEYTPRVWLRFLFYSIHFNFCRRHQEHLRAWLADPLGRDQYVTYRGDEVLISWHGKPSQCEIAHKPVRFFPLPVYGQISMFNVVAGLEGLSLCSVVTDGDIHCHPSSSRCSSMGWPVMEASATFCASACQIN